MSRYQYIKDDGVLSEPTTFDDLRKLNLPRETKLFPENCRTSIDQLSTSSLPSAPLAEPPFASQASARKSLTKRFYPTFLLALFLGMFGAHRFYAGKRWTGVLQLVTLGGLMVWSLVDLITILLGRFTDKNGAAIPNSSPKASWALFIIVIALSVVTQGSHSNSRAHSAQNRASARWGSPGEKSLVGMYECPEPLVALRLTHEGIYTMEALQTGQRYSGKWNGNGQTGVLRQDIGGTLTFVVQTNGALKVKELGYTFTRAR